MKKLLLLFVGIFALLSCEVKNSYQEPEAGKDFSLVDEISVSVNTTENTRCLLYVGDPYVDGHLVGEPILIVALFLSAIGKTGPILWSMSGPANQLLRQLGLLLFLAEVGTSAGTNLVATFQESGWLLFGVGAAITLVPMLVAVFVGVFVFKISILDLLGTITGGMTSTPGLAAADSMTDSNIPSVAYATVYPIAMVFLILFIQIIATMV